MTADDCPHFLSETEQDTQGSSPEDDEQFPWTGRPLGLVDVRFVSATKRPHLIGIAGAADAGKTTLLSLLFLTIYRGRSIGPFRFAGSYSLNGWENIARYLQLNAGEGIQFPPHTPRAGRLPGLLHLAISEGGLQGRDILLTDASGEWFTAWTDRPDEKTAAGAKWITRHSDKMLIVADTAALTGANSGAARRSLEFLIRRMANVFGTDGVALVWTKCDLDRPQTLVSVIEKHFASCFPEAPVFETGVPDQTKNGGESTLQQLDKLFSWAFLTRSRRVTMPMRSTRSDDPFLSYRGSP